MKFCILEKLIPGIDIFWCLDDCLKYLKVFGNLPPVNYKKGGLRGLRINLFAEDSVNYLKYFLDDLKDENIDTIFNSVWPMLHSSGWKIIDTSSSIDSIPVKRIAIPYWSKMSSDSLSLNQFSQLSVDRDYFYYIQNAIDYLQVISYFFTYFFYIYSIFTPLIVIYHFRLLVIFIQRKI